MKKGIFKFLAATFFISFVLSSCLGDTSTKIEQDNALAYVKSMNGTKVAITNSIAFTNSNLNALDLNRFYFLDFSVATKDGQNASGAYNAKSVTVLGDGLPLPKGDALAMNNPQSTVDIYPTTMNVVFYSGYEQVLDDNWLFAYECRVYAEDLIEDPHTKLNNIELVATLLTSGNDNDQVTGSDAKPLENNQAVVRLYLKRKDTRTIDETKAKVGYKGYASINLRDLRSYFQSRVTSSADGTVGIIQFKYIINTAKDNETPVPLAKSFGSLDEERPDYYMIIE